MSTENVSVVITDTGARRVAADIASIGEAAEGSEHLLSLLKETLGALGLGLAVKELIETADAFTLLENKIKLVTDSQAQLEVVTDRLLDVANHTRVSIEDTVNVYQRLAQSAKQLGISQNEAIEVTEALNEAVILSGTNSQEASRGVLELAHGFAQGKLQSREFRVIMKDLPEVARVMATSMNTNTAHLYAMAEQGKLTGRALVDAFLKAHDALEQRFGKTVVTVDQAMTVLHNTWTVYLGDLNTSAGITATLGQAIIYVAQHIDEFARVAAALAFTLGTNLAIRAIPSVISALTTFNGTLLANPLLLVISLLTVFSDKIYVTADGLVQLRDVGVVVWNDLVKLAQWATAQYHKFLDLIVAKGEETFADLNKSSLTFPEMIAEGLDNILRMFYGAAVSIVQSMEFAWEHMKSGFSYAYDYIKAKLTGGDLPKRGKDLGYTLADAMINGFVQGWDALGDKGPVRKALDSLLGQAEVVAATRRAKEKADADARAKALKSLDVKGPPGPTEPEKFKKTFGSELEELRKEGILLTKNTEARQVQADVMKVEEHLRRNLTQSELEQVAHASLLNERLKDRNEALQTLGGPTEEYTRKVNALNAIMRDNAPLTAQVTEEVNKLELAFLQSQTGGGFVDAYTRQLRIMQLQTRNAVADMGAQFATIFGPGGTIVQGIGNAVAQAIVFKENFGQAIKQVAQSVISTLISSLVQLGINMVLNAALGNSLAVAAAATSAATAAAVSAAWGPAATLVNAATFGAGAAAGTAALAGSLSTIKGLAAVGTFETGGYTGDGPKNAVAGIVHKGEYVLNSAATRRLGTSNLDTMNKGMAWNQPVTMNVKVQNSIPNATYDVQQVSRNDVVIIAKQIVRQDTPDVVAADISNPSSRTSKALSTHTTATRKRG